MRILCCYANLHPTTAGCLAKFAEEAELVDVTGDPTGYWHSVLDRWKGADDLLVIEQDMEITAEVVPSLKDCPEQWCLYSYQGPLGPLARHLGCTRFRKELQSVVPLKNTIGERQHWSTVDRRIALKLTEAGYEPHVHGELNHLHNYPKGESKLGRLAMGEDAFKDFLAYLVDSCRTIVIQGEETND